jgi:putative glutamine amidotransferase
MSAPPVVGILCGRSPEDRYSTHRGYVASVSAAGGIPVLLPSGPDVDPDAIATVVAQCRAIVVTGGGDVDPQRYGAPVDQLADILMEVDPARDTTEVAVVETALNQGKRVLGVCRGAQLLAVLGGGTLILDLPAKGIEGHWNEVHQYEPVHGIQAEGGSIAAGILGSLTEVNSIHHQAIADPGQTLRATAWSPDGVIEAVESPGVLGVQWHPERMFGLDERHLAPFTWVVGQ